MARLSIIVLFLYSFFPDIGWAETEVDFIEGGIKFTLPDSWQAKGIFANVTPPGMDPKDPLYVRWKRADILNKDGIPVSAGMNVVVFNVPPDASVEMASVSLMKRRKWPINGFLTTEKDGFSFPNAMGYLTEFTPQAGLVLKALVIHSINNGKFVELSFSVTDEIFPQVESEFRSIIKSLKLSNYTSNIDHVKRNQVEIIKSNISSPLKISIENIAASKPGNVAIASVKIINNGVHIIGFTGANAFVSRFMRNLDEKGWIPTLREVRSVNACGNRISQFSLDIKGDVSKLSIPNQNNEKIDIEFDVGAHKFKCAVQLK